MKSMMRAAAVTLLFVNGVAALAGGIGLIGDPSGHSLGWTTDLLAPSPFSDFLIPGIILFIGNGMFSVLAAILTIRKMDRYPLMILLQGAFLCIWLVIQMIMLQFYHPLHLACGIIGVLLIICGYLLSITHYQPRNSE